MSGGKAITAPAFGPGHLKCVLHTWTILRGDVELEILHSRPGSPHPPIPIAKAYLHSAFLEPGKPLLLRREDLEVNPGLLNPTCPGGLFGDNFHGHYGWSSSGSRSPGGASHDSGGQQQHHHHHPQHHAGVLPGGGNPNASPPLHHQAEMGEDAFSSSSSSSSPEGQVCGGKHGGCGLLEAQELSALLGPGFSVTLEFVPVSSASVIPSLPLPADHDQDGMDECLIIP